MESSAKRSGRQTTNGAHAHRGSPKLGRRPAASALEVTDVVQHGMGRGSRIDLTIVFADRKVRLTGLPAKHVLSYGRIEKSAIEQGVVLPYLRFANREWRKVLSPAMERASVEPWLEGEEIAEAIAQEIRALLEDCARGESASDLTSGKVVERGDRFLVSPKTLVPAVRSRLVDDVLPQATVAEAATAHLGMRQSRPRFADARTRPCAWAFPMPLAAARVYREALEAPRDERSVVRRADPLQRGDAVTTEAAGIESVDDGACVASSPQTAGCELDRLDGENRDSAAGSVPGRLVLGRIPRIKNKMGAGSSGLPKTALNADTRDGESQRSRTEFEEGTRSDVAVSAATRERSHE